jgi:hypothetical protein
VNIDRTPEAKKIPSLLMVSTQCGNVILIAYKLITGYCISEATTRRILPVIVTAMLLTAAGTLVLIGIFWKSKVYVGNHKYVACLLWFQVITQACLSPDRPPISTMLTTLPTTPITHQLTNHLPTNYVPGSLHH